MKKLLLILASFALSSFVMAEDAKKAKAEEMTIEGVAQCAKCTLKTQKGCQTAIVVGEGEEAKIYYVAGKDARKGFHSKICGAGTKVAVKATGKVREAKNGKTMIANPEIVLAEVTAE